MTETTYVTELRDEHFRRAGFRVREAVRPKTLTAGAHLEPVVRDRQRESAVLRTKTFGPADRKRATRLGLKRGGEDVGRPEKPGAQLAGGRRCPARSEVGWRRRRVVLLRQAGDKGYEDVWKKAVGSISAMSSEAAAREEQGRTEVLKCASPAPEERLVESQEDESLGSLDLLLWVDSVTSMQSLLNPLRPLDDAPNLAREDLAPEPAFGRELDERRVQRKAGRPGIDAVEE